MADREAVRSRRWATVWALLVMPNVWAVVVLVATALGDSFPAAPWTQLLPPALGATTAQWLAVMLVPLLPLTAGSFRRLRGRPAWGLLLAGWAHCAVNSLLCGLLVLAWQQLV